MESSLYRYISHFFWTMEVSPLFGWFHSLLLLALLIVMAVLLQPLRNTKDKGVRLTLFIYSIFFMIIEAHKLLLCAAYRSPIGELHFDWGVFPFQLCSTPLYVALIASFLRKNTKFKELLYDYLATYGLITGILVVIYPMTIFNNLVFINV